MGFGCFWGDFRGLKHFQECIDIPSYSWKRCFRDAWNPRESWNYYTLCFFLIFIKRQDMSFQSYEAYIVHSLSNSKFKVQGKSGVNFCFLLHTVLKDLFSTYDFFLFLIKNCHFSTEGAYYRFSLAYSIDSCFTLALEVIIK